MKKVLVICSPSYFEKHKAAARNALRSIVQKKDLNFVTTEVSCGVVVEKTIACGSLDAICFVDVPYSMANKYHEDISMQYDHEIGPEFFMIENKRTTAILNSSIVCINTMDQLPSILLQANTA